MDMSYSEAVTAADVARMQEHRERVEREERAWFEMQLHHQLHNTWDSPDECPVCIDDALDAQIAKANS